MRCFPSSSSSLRDDSVTRDAKTNVSSFPLKTFSVRIRLILLSKGMAKDLFDKLYQSRAVAQCIDTDLP